MGDQAGWSVSQLDVALLARSRIQPVQCSKIQSGWWVPQPTEIHVLTWCRYVIYIALIVNVPIDIQIFNIKYFGPEIQLPILKKHHPFLMTLMLFFLEAHFFVHTRSQGYKCQGQPWCSSTLAFNLGLMRHCPCWRINVFTFRGILQCHAQCIGTWHLGPECFGEMGMSDIKVFLEWVKPGSGKIGGR